MKKTKSLIIVFLSTCYFATCFLSSAQATFPGIKIAHWDPSISSDRTDPQYLIVQDLVQEKEYDAALAILEQKAKKKSHRGTALVLKALILNEQGKYLKALSVIRLGQIIQAHHPAIHFGFCQINRNLGEAELSKRACEIAVQQHFENPLSHFELAQTLMALGEMKEASRELTIAAELDPQNAQYHYQRGLIFSYFNDTNQAEKAFQKALFINPSDLDSAYQLAYTYTISGKQDRAKKYINKILDSKVQHPKIKSTRALLNYINQNAINKLPKVIVPSDYHMSRSQSFYKSKKYGLALLEIQTAAQLKPNNRKIYEILTGLSSILLRLDLAEKSVNHLIQLSKESDLLQARGYQKLGDINIMQGELNEARKYYEIALTLGDPKNLAKIALNELPKQPKEIQNLVKPKRLFIDPLEGLNHQGEIFAQYRMYKSALGIYSMILKINPNHLLAKLNAGAAYFKNGQYNRAVALLEKILVTHPNHKNIDAHLLLLAQAYVKKGDFKEGMNNLEKLVNLDPNSKAAIRANPEFKKLRDFEQFKQLLQ